MQDKILKLSSDLYHPVLLSPLPEQNYSDYIFLKNDHRFVAFLNNGLVFCEFTDWSNRCATTFREDGLWTYLNQIVACSPWVLYIFMLATFHFSWSTFLLLNQLIQVFISLIMPLGKISNNLVVKEKNWNFKSEDLEV